jgi:hypothetical protein
MSKWDPTFVEVPDVELDLSSQRLAVLPQAASPIVALLARHCGEKLPNGWTVTDEPRHPEGLVGGTFDDAGFTSDSEGAFFQRRSFRDPPEAGGSNLVLHATDNETCPSVSGIVSRSRVLPLQLEDWVIELDFVDEGRKYLRTSPRALVASLSATFGAHRATADGPIVPGLVLDTQSLTIENL